MFIELSKMLEAAGSALSLNVVSLGDGRLAVTVMPKGEWKNKALGAGLSVQGTAQELDEGLVEQIERYTTARKTLSEQTEATLKVIAAAEKETKEKASAAIKKAGATPKVTAAPAKPPAKVNAASNEVEDADDEESATVDLF